MNPREQVLRDLEAAHPVRKLPEVSEWYESIVRPDLVLSRDEAHVLLQLVHLVQDRNAAFLMQPSLRDVASALQKLTFALEERTP